jgi:hypothetical protein
MYLGEYEQLGGFGKKLRKFVKKVAAPVAHIGAAVFTGGASLALSANIIKAQQERKAKEAQARAQLEADKAAIAAQERIAFSQQQGSVAPAASRMRLSPSIAPPAGLVQQFMPVPTSTGGGGDYGPSPMYDSAPTAKPAWLMPVAIGGAGLLAVLLLKKR